MFVGFGAFAVAATQVDIVPSGTSVHIGESVTFVVTGNSNAESAVNEIGLELCDATGTPFENLGISGGGAPSVSSGFSWTAPAAGTYFFDAYAWNDDRSQLVRTGIVTVTVMANNTPPQVSGTPSATSVQTGDVVMFDVLADCQDGLDEIGLESCDASGMPTENQGIVGVMGSSAGFAFTWVAPAPGTYYFDVYAWNDDRSLLTRSGVIAVVVN